VKVELTSIPLIETKLEICFRTLNYALTEMKTRVPT
jgi:hypothetical protein